MFSYPVFYSETPFDTTDIFTNRVMESSSCVLEAIGGVVEKEDEEDLYENTSGTEKVSHFPEWAAYYAMYGEGDDLSDDEIAMIDDYMQKNGYGDLVDVMWWKLCRNS